MDVENITSLDKLKDIANSINTDSEFIIFVGLAGEGVPDAKE